VSDAAAWASEVEAALRAVAVPADAAPMAAYLRDQFSFLGVKARARRAAVRPLVAAAKGLSGAALLDRAEACWAAEPRELQHVGVDLLRRYGRALGPDALPRVRGLVRAKAWWDTVDALAAHVVGGLVQRNPQLVAAMDRWVEDDDRWVARTAILHQLTYKDGADQERLFRYVRHHASATDFFLRKACGWALRQHGKVAPDAVRAFVSAHEGELSGLTRREALKHLRRR